MNSKSHDYATLERPIKDAGTNLQIRIQGVDGSVATFTQNDPDLVNHTLQELNPARILTQTKITIVGNHSVTTFIPPLITRIDLITDRLSVWDFHFVIGALVELTEAEFHKFLHDLQGRVQTRTSGDYPVFLDIEMVNGQHSFLWMEIVAGLPADRLLRIYSLLKERSLIFGLRTGGIGVLNLANMVRFSVHPDPLAGPAKAWPAHQANGSKPDRFAGNLRGSVDGTQPLSRFPQNSRPNFILSRMESK
ncbi:MAG: hypothetical protein ABSF10_11305 [Verrucomicrobiota bacterium]